MPPYTRTPEPPYYAVIFTSLRTPGDDGYAAMAERMETLAASQPGYLGIDSVREASGLGISVSYFRTLEDVRRWKANAEHRVAQRRGKEAWYRAYNVRVAKVERAYDVEAPPAE